ncbi:TetR/AcrR family transcriptional regulator [Tsukamurella tyrosinosolvens]|uniref:TetR/AcrR family transcriptional regulator n=1 Tax=Tsukamurella tyrosinosolvens TaxID=57704 RepID=UPI001EE77EE4|nr:TetR/AcrR family transcriptional regulator [Tsukamurella tyrosinosolvens]MEC4611666.1 TetR/AcrR family transcriptional regulator [Tsukamurella tyrosinosolvens]
MTRTRMTATERREQILDVAHDIVAAEGFHAATPRRIADDAGVTRTVLYQQFGDVAGLLVALIDREADRIGAQYLDAVAEVAPESDNDPFVSAFEGAVRAIDENPAGWRLFLLPPEGAPPALHERLAESRDAVVAFMELSLRSTFPGIEDPEYLARVVHATARELLCLHLTDPENATVERLTGLIRRLRTFAPPP